MKKQLLLSLAIGVAFGANAQHSRTSSGKIIPLAQPYAIDKAGVSKSAVSDVDGPSFQSYVKALQPKNRTSGNRAFSAQIIGSSIYDLQTNSSVCDRVILNADGTISATWNMSHDATPTSTPNRGTGYTYFNGTSWATAPTTRLESVRTGWPSIGVTGSGREVVVSHEALETGGTGNIYFLSRPVKGTGAWTETTLGATVTDSWPRLAVGGSDGNTIHVISQTSGTDKPPFMGQDGALAYSRSIDGGANWNKLHTVIPEISSTYYRGFGGDNYAIDAKGDTVVILTGGEFQDVVLLKSINNGDTWTKTIIKQFPIPMYDVETMISDTNNDAGADHIFTNDGSLAVLLDNAGKAHVWYGNMEVWDETAVATTYTYGRFSDGLMYWNENMGSAAPVMITSALDIDNDQVLDVSNLGTYYVSLTSMPSAGIDAQGRIFVSYAGIYEGVADGGSPGVGKSFRHTYVMRSDDGGATWCNPIDVDDPAITLEDFRESVFCSMAKRVDGYIHLVYQADQIPGHGLSGDPAGSIDVHDAGYESDFWYVKLPVADVSCEVGINEKEETLSNMELYPNPASSDVTLSFTVTHPTQANVVIYNAMGQKTSEFFNELNAKGTHMLNINTAGYKPGIYFVNSVIDGKTVSKKLVIE